MACETRLKPRQTPQQRKAEVVAAVGRIQAGIIQGRVKVVVGPQGAVAFQGVTEDQRDGMNDACVYRHIMATGSALAKMAITKAEQMSGRAINRQVVGQGVHSHDGGKTWHDGH